MAAAGLSSPTAAVRRLLKDLQEVKENPLLNVVAEPLEENLFEWHVNIRTSEEGEDSEVNPLTEAVFHLILVFPSDFPNSGPNVFLCTPLPHPNVEVQNDHSVIVLNVVGSNRNVRPRYWKVSLWDCIPAYKGWSSAYGVQSVLLQLQTFLLQEDLLYDTRKVQSLEAAAERARDYICQRCGHTSHNHHPKFLTLFDAETIARNRLKKPVSRPLQKLLLEKSLPSLNVVSKGNRQPVEDISTQTTGSEWKFVKTRKRIHSAGNESKSTHELHKESCIDTRIRQQNRMQIGGKNQSREPSRASIFLDIETEDAIMGGLAVEPYEARMGDFGLLPQEALTTILTLLPPESLSCLSRTCRGLRIACEEGYVWKTLMQRHYPATSLKAASMEDWKHAFMLEQCNVIESLRCFHSKSTYEEEVLGFPVSFTLNPRTRDVDYIQVHLDILSESSYQEGVRTTADNQKFTLLLPLYINAEHFRRALPLIRKTATELAPLSRRNRFHKDFVPEMILDFMPKVLNTMVVLLSDKGVQASERAIEGYCMVHRLFLALCDEFKLWRKAEDAIVRFKSYPEARLKANCRDLGHLMARLSVCTTHETSWSEIVRPLIGEVFDRSVLWICKSDPSIVKSFERAGRKESDGVDEGLLRAAWEGSRVALRLSLFHSAFLNFVARPPKVSLQKVAAGYDALYGMPSTFLKKKLQAAIKSVLEVEYDWPFFFHKMGMQCPSKKYLTGWMRQCWKNSLEKGYHDKNTNFEKIHSGGVSTILLKGESYRVPPNLRKAKMHEVWRYTEHTQYLDASCLVYDSQGQFMEVIDYCHRISKDKAIRHSGDLMDYDKKQGTHIIEIDFPMLSARVQELYFTMSGYAGATLEGFKLPFVQLKDVETDMDLCQYTLESKKLGSQRSVIMCRMFKTKVEEGPVKWDVSAIGRLGPGSADDYHPLKLAIKRLIHSRNPSLAQAQSSRPKYLEE